MHSRFLCNIALCSIGLLPSPVTSTTGWCFCFGSFSSFFLELFPHWSPVACWAPADLGSSSFSVLFLPFHTVHGVLKARVLKWFAIPFSSGPRFVRPLHHDRPSWVAPQAWISFIELDKAVVHVIKLASCLWMWFQSVCPLRSSLRAYRLTWVSLTLNVGCLFMAAPPKRSCCSLPRAWGGSSQPHVCTVRAARSRAPSQPDGRHRNQIDYILCSQRWRSSIQSAKTRMGADCGSNHELLIAKFRLILKKVQKPLDHSGMT